MTKSKKQFAAKQDHNSPDDFHRQVEVAFGDHPWPASRGELLEHASRQHMFAKHDIARLKQIPHRDYHSAQDLMDATRQTTAVAQGAGPVASAEQNRRAMGETASANGPLPSATRYDEQMR